MYDFDDIYWQVPDWRIQYVDTQTGPASTVQPLIALKSVNERTNSQYNVLGTNSRMTCKAFFWKTVHSVFL